MAITSGPWSVKGVDPKAREIAKDLARRSGMTLGEWLNQVIAEGGEPEAPPFQAPYREPYGSDPLARRPTASAHAPEAYRGHGEFEARGDLARVAEAISNLSARLEAAEHRSTLAISGVDQSVMGVLSRLEGVEREHGAAASRLETALDEQRADQGRIADRLRRVEQDEPSRLIALKSIETSLTRVAQRLEESDARDAAAMQALREEIGAVAQRVDAFGQKADPVPELREAVEAVSRRMMRLEEAAASAPDTYADASMVEQALTKMATRLEQGEARAGEAARALGQSLAGLDARLRGTESRIGALDPGAAERRFEALAAELSAKVEASRTEMAERLREAASGQFEKVEGALRDVTAHVEQSERRSAQAIDRMGQEVMRVAHTLSQRVGAVESRSAQAVEHAGAEMSKAAAAMDSRMGQADQAQAEALEKLGTEIARIAEKLAERISSSERRSADAIDDIGAQVSGVVDRIHERQEQVSAGLTDRIRQSEERTARLIEEARERIDRRAAEAPAPAPEPAPAPVAAPPPAAEPPTAQDSPLDFEPETPSASTGTASPPEPPLSSDPFDALDDFAPSGFGVAPDPVLFDPDPAPRAVASPGVDAHEAAGTVEEVAPAGRASTRELLESARAAARNAASPSRPAAVAAPPYEAPEQPRPLSRRFGLSLPKRKKKESAVTLRTMAIASGTAAAITVAAVGAGMVYSQHPDGWTDKGARPAAGVLTASAPMNPTAAPAPAAVADETLAGPPTQVDSAPAAPELAAVALAPPGGAPTRPAAPAQPAPAPLAPVAASALPSASALYASGLRRWEAGDRGGLADLQRAANLGFPAAQFYLGKLYDAGGSGLAKNPVEARRWTERAAQAGDVKAMHNLGLYYFEGDGGEKNVTAAAGWFKRAAELGLADSQYNLARLYENGYGVSQNPAEAYKWYLVAAASGDQTSRVAALNVRKRLTPEAIAVAERSASTLRALAQAQAASSAPPAR